MSTTTTSNGYDVDRSAALARLQSRYGMPGGHAMRVPLSSRTPQSPTHGASDAAADEEDDDKSFMTSSASSSLSSASSLYSAASSFKAKAASLFKATGGSQKKGTDSPAPAMASTPSSTAKPDPEVVLAHLSAQYGLGGGGYKLPTFEPRSKSKSKADKQLQQQRQQAQGTDSPEEILAKLMDAYGAPGRSQIRLRT